MSSFYEKVDGIEHCIDDEIPFEVPEGWEWSRIRTICKEIVDCPHSTPKYYAVDGGYYSIDTTCIESDGTITRFRYVDKTAFLNRIVRLKPQENDIVYTREGSIGRAAKLPAVDNICLGQRVMLLRASSYINVDLLRNALMSPLVLEVLEGKTRGIGAKHINVSDVCNALVPVPPLAEQQRVVAKINEILPALTTL